MATSPLDPGNTDNRRDRITDRGHGTRALGPSDSSDSGSDLIGSTAARDIGDADLDSDSDRSGTGERVSAARDPAQPDGADIDTDRIEQGPGEASEGEEEE